MEQVQQALISASSALQNHPEVGQHLLDAPQVLGWTSFTDWSVQVQVLAKTKPGKPWQVGRELRKAVLEAFQQNGIRWQCQPNGWNWGILQPC
jgi:small conductance mechanosensitive channel